MPFSTLGLHDRLVQGIRATGYHAPTTIQSLAIPPVLAGSDIVGLAHTGTGKTAAFALPMLQRFSLSHNGHRNIRGLVLTPTRELAKQIEDAINEVGRFTNISTLSVYGGVSMENQVKRLRRGVDIVIATPGRLLDHLARRTLSLAHVEMLVLDEADRMFDMGFINDVRKIVERTPQTRQTLLFSATMPETIRQLTQSIQKSPKMIRVGTETNPATITQYFYAVQQEQKLSLLAHILEAEKMESVLVFSRTKHGADKICKKLEQRRFSTVAIHSNRSQGQRQNALAGFKQGRYRILVATDIAARGIDVEGISHVVNYDTPMAPEDYIHRIGRTGRASLTGDAITFVSSAERNYAKRIEHLLGKRLSINDYPGFVPAKIPETGETKRTTARPARHHRSEQRTQHGSGRSHAGHPARDQRRDNGASGNQRDGKNHNGDGRFKRDEQHGMRYYQQQKSAEHPRQQSGHVVKNDWMSLISAGDEMKRKVKKKLKRMFSE
ncbi:MAG: DEAD/DEAH box helicase [Bacteroidota bacterium]